MMKKINSSKLSALKLMIIIPIALFSVYLVSCSKDSYIDTSFQNDTKETLIENEHNTSILLPPPPPPVIVSNQKSQNNQDSKRVVLVEDEVFESFAIDEKPEYPGGDLALMKYVAENTKYPQEALDNAIEGNVYVRFALNKKGKVEKAKILRAVDPLLEAEALRVVYSMPAWKPGMYKGQAVSVWFIIPVKFMLQ